MASLEPQSNHVQLFRVVSAEEVDAAFSGATERSSRWTSPGQPVAYAARSPAGALLEFLVHLQGDTPPDLRMVVATLAGELICPVGELPEGWGTRPYRTEVQAVGDAWLASHASLGLEVPSALCHRTPNVLINTGHRDHGNLSILSRDVIEIDPRLRF